MNASVTVLRVVRLPVLFVRTRSLSHSMLAIAGICVLLPLLEGRVETGTLDPLLVMQIVPALLAAVVGVAMWAPIGELERTAARSLPLLRGGFAIALVTLASGGALLAVQGWSVIDIEWIAFRNVVGLSGLALLGARVIDPRLSWIVPTVWFCIAFIGQWIAPIETGPRHWMWSVLDASARSSWIVAGTLVVCGIAVIAIAGPREVPSETA